MKPVLQSRTKTTGAVVIASCVRRDGCDGTGGFAEGGKRHAYTIFYAAFPCPLSPDGSLCKSRMGAAIGASQPMKLLVFYIVFVAIGEAIAYAAGKTVELWSPAT